jgi:hypothetical protein
MKNPISAKWRTVGGLFTACVTLIVTGCGGGGQTVAVTAPQFSLDQLRAAPPQTTIGAQTLQMTAQLFLDTMPTVGPGVRGISGVLTISSADNSPIPAGITLVTAYADQGSDEGAFATLTPVTTGTGATPTLRGNLLGGPAFSPGSRANVVVLLRDAAGSQYLLRATNLLIVGAD